MKIAIIGAGMAGLSCARALEDAGLAPVIFDKGRGVGGRLATRRATGGLQFDHGAQYITARDPGFRALIARAEAAGAVGRWALERDDPAFVGLPGMSGLAKFLARDLDIRQGIEVTGILPAMEGWRVAWAGGTETFDRVVSTAPAAQSRALIGETVQDAGALRDVVMAPCVTLMLALDPGVTAPRDNFRDPGSDISWIAFDSGKPGRPDVPCYVAQAGPAWSRAHLELDREAIAEAMRPRVCEMLGVSEASVIHQTAHRWRYALASSPLGAPFWSDPSGTLFAGGDWCIAPRVEAAWESGTAIAGAITG